MADDSGLMNEVLAETSFLYGGNATFVEDLYARWAKEPTSVEASWQSFFASLHETREAAQAAVVRPVWTARSAPAARPDWLSALDGLWPAVEAKLSAKIAERTSAAPTTEAVRAATLDSLRAIMMIRAYRMRGHLAAHLDPLNLVKIEDQPELDPKTYGFGPKDMDRRIYIDNVLGLDAARRHATELRDKAQAALARSGLRDAAWLSLLADKPITLEGGEGSAFIRPSSVGALLGIMPWNYPYYQVARFAGPNLLLGNTIILKHAPQCPESAAALQQIRAMRQPCVARDVGR